MAERRALGGLPALGLNAARAFALVPRWLMMPETDLRRRREQRFFARLLAGIGVEIEPVGAPVDEPGTLFVANHISFTDVLALALLLDVRFVAKADVRRWPLIGAWAERLGTLFVERGARGQAGAQVSAIGEVLRGGGRVLLFPEGTTSDGLAVLPFRSALLEAAAVARRVQPVALTYSDGARRAYVGEESLGANLLRLAPHRARLRIEFLPPVEVPAPFDRKRLAGQLRDAISAARMPG